MTTEPQEYPIYDREGHLYSFLDCTCATTCLGRECPYCAFEDDSRTCPGAE